VNPDIQGTTNKINLKKTLNHSNNLSYKNCRVWENIEESIKTSAKESLVSAQIETV